jgi:hypothetical protein
MLFLALHTPRLNTSPQRTSFPKVECCKEVSDPRRFVNGLKRTATHFRAKLSLDLGISTKVPPDHWRGEEETENKFRLTVLKNNFIRKSKS